MLIGSCCSYFWRSWRRPTLPGRTAALGSGGSACAMLFISPLRCGRAGPLSAAVSVGCCMSSDSEASRRWVCTDRPYMRKEPLFLGHALKKVACRAPRRWVSAGITGLAGAHVHVGGCGTRRVGEAGVRHEEVAGAARGLVERAPNAPNLRCVGHRCAWFATTRPRVLVLDPHGACLSGDTPRLFHNSKGVVE